MQTQTDQQAERKAAGAIEGALLRKHFAPVLEQAIVGFQQVHRHSFIRDRDGSHRRSRQ